MIKPFYVCWDKGCSASFSTLKAARNAIYNAKSTDFRNGPAQIFDALTKRRGGRRILIERVEPRI